MEKVEQEYKSIRVKPEAYDKLSQFRKGGESFTEALDRLFAQVRATKAVADELIRIWGGY